MNSIHTEEKPKMIINRRDALVLVLCLLATGCNGVPYTDWLIEVDNRSSSPVDAAVTYGIKTANGNSQGNASGGSLAAGKKTPLTSGQQTTIIRTVKVTRGTDVQELAPDVEIAIGKKYVILVGADGKVSGALSNR